MSRKHKHKHRSQQDTTPNQEKRLIGMISCWSYNLMRGCHKTFSAPIIYDVSPSGKRGMQCNECRHPSVTCLRCPTLKPGDTIQEKDLCEYCQSRTYFERAHKNRVLSSTGLYRVGSATSDYSRTSDGTWKSTSSFLTITPSKSRRPHKNLKPF